MATIDFEKCVWNPLIDKEKKMVFKACHKAHKLL